MLCAHSHYLIRSSKLKSLAPAIHFYPVVCFEHLLLYLRSSTQIGALHPLPLLHLKTDWLCSLSVWVFASHFYYRHYFSTLDASTVLSQSIINFEKSSFFAHQLSEGFFSCSCSWDTFALGLIWLALETVEPNCFDATVFHLLVNPHWALLFTVAILCVTSITIILFAIFRQTFPLFTADFSISDWLLLPLLFTTATWALFD